jgi:hypothetical protein
MLSFKGFALLITKLISWLCFSSWEICTWEVGYILGFHLGELGHNSTYNLHEGCTLEE